MLIILMPHLALKGAVETARWELVNTLMIFGLENKKRNAACIDAAYRSTC